MNLEYRQVDVFAEGPLAGNGLAVVITDQPLGGGLMRQLTQELRQFETIFLTPSNEPDHYMARVFTMEEELPFAGHPAIGAAAVLHERLGGEKLHWRLSLPAREVSLTSTRRGPHFRVSMNQGRVEFGDTVAADAAKAWLDCFGLEPVHLDPRLPISVASTGLPYLVLPVTAEGLTQARIRVDDLEQRLAGVGAKFAYLLDLEQNEGRTWDNAGLVEDIATGSAAGPVAGLLVRHGWANVGEEILLRQGRFVGRPSEMVATLMANGGSELGDVTLSGSVVTIARGQFDAQVLGDPADVAAASNNSNRS
jgi:PhzF family phenazine biosynthesis protein